MQIFRFLKSHHLESAFISYSCTLSSSPSSNTMGSAPIGVRRHLDQTLPASSVHHCLAQLLEWGFAPFGDIVQPLPMRSSAPVCALHSPEHHQSLILLLLCILHYVSEQSQFSAYQFLHNILFQFYSTV